MVVIRIFIFPMFVFYFLAIFLWWASHGFDRAKSNRVDSTAKQKPLGLGLPGRRSEKHNCKWQLLHWGTTPSGV